MRLALIESFVEITNAVYLTKTTPATFQSDSIYPKQNKHVNTKMIVSHLQNEHKIQVPNLCIKCRQDDRIIVEELTGPTTAAGLASLIHRVR